MNTKEIWFGVGGLVIGVVVTGFLFPGARPGYMMGGFNNNSYGPGSGQMMGQNLERHFIEQMIPHHEGAIAMAELALEKSARLEIKTLAQNIIKAQEGENEKMIAWYADWYDGHPAKGSANTMNGGMMSNRGMHVGGQEDIQALENATDFDRAFVEQMIPHHQLAIMMAQMLQAGTQRPEMLELAKNIIYSQSAEIEQMQSWYENWF